MTSARDGRWFRRTTVLVVAAVVAAMAAIVWSGVRAEHDKPTSPRVVRSTAPRFGSLDEMAGASDVVIIGTAVEVSPGRVLTDPTDPSAGVETVLVGVEVELALRGEPGDLVVVEHEAYLLDGTPVAVDGVPAPQVGERSAWFLVAGQGDAVGCHAVVGPQGRVPVVVDQLLAPGDEVQSVQLLSTAPVRFVPSADVAAWPRRVVRRRCRRRWRTARAVPGTRPSARA